MSTSFATLADVEIQSGKHFSPEEVNRINILLAQISDVLRSEARKYGKDLDVLSTDDSEYAATVRMVTADVVIRILRQSYDGDPMIQESQSAMGYSWSGTAAIAGGGAAAAILKNDLVRLGLRRQKVRSINCITTYEERQ